MKAFPLIIEQAGGDMKRKNHREYEWARKVSDVFTTNPRDGSSKHTLWIPRSNEERDFAYFLGLKGTHICIDGPTGSGKTSLSRTQLNHHKTPYVEAHITHNMTWGDFCKEIVKNAWDYNRKVVGKYNEKNMEMGIESGLPTFKFSFKVTTQELNDEDALQNAKNNACSWCETEICDQLVQSNFALFVDDFENANEEIVVRIADCCKKLTQKEAMYGGRPNNVKIIITGTDDIYRKLRIANPSLDSRVKEVSLGTLPAKNLSWKFLLDGWEKLNLKNPATLRSSNEENIRECIDSAYEAADGLLKSLNELGSDISMKAVGRTTVTPDDIIKTANNYAMRMLNLARREFPAIIKCVENNIDCRSVLSYLGINGIGKVHNIDDIKNFCIKHGMSTNKFNMAIHDLCTIDFIVKTGWNDEIIFTRNPTLAHLLVMVHRNPNKYGKPEELYGEKGQLLLDLQLTTNM